MVNNIKNNTISKIDAKKDLNALNEIKNVEKIKYKKRTPGQKKLINLFNDLFNIISTDKAESESQENKNKKVKSRNEENEKVESRKEENENEYEDYENEYEYENEDDDETIDQNETIINLNDSLDEKIYKSKSFEEQIKLLKKKDLKGYWPYKDFDDKELRSKFFKRKLADMSNEIDGKLFETIFGHTLIKLADKLISTSNKEKNQIIVNDINSNKNKLLERDELGDWVFKAQQRSDLKYTIDLILNFNEIIQVDMVWASIEKI